MVNVCQDLTFGLRYLLTSTSLGMTSAAVMQITEFE